MAKARTMLLGLACAAALCVPAGARAQSAATIVGTVTSEGGNPVSEALVTLVGQRLTATTNGAGQFRLVVMSDRVVAGTDTLRVERLGYGSRSVAVQIGAGEVRADIVLAFQAIALDQLVVSGTAGNQQRRAQPAVVSTINAADITAKAPISSVTELINGRTPSVSITGASGTTGTASRINIRGQASLNLSNTPLVFVDGVRISSGARNAAGSVGGQQIDGLSDINPDDIESIEIVKGPAAATLYGSDASAGVIQILTKRGRAGGRTFSQNLSFEYDGIDPNFTPDTNYYRCTATDVGTTGSLCQGKTAGTVVTDNPLERQDAFINGSAGMLDYSARGSGTDFGYFFSFGADNEDGTLRNNSLRRRTGRANFTWSAHPKVTVDAGIGLSRTNVKLPFGDQATYGYLIGAGFGTPRTVRQATDGTVTGGWLNATESVQSVSAVLNSNNATRLTPTATVRYNPASWFSNEVTLGADYLRQSRTTFYPKNENNWYSVIQNTGQVQNESADGTQYTVTYLGNINRAFGDESWLTSNLSFGGQYIETVNTQVAVSGNGLITNSANAVSQTSANRVGADGYNAFKQLGTYGQLMLGMHDRLFLKVAGRVDRSSAFAQNAQTFFLPSFGVSYVASQDPLFRGVLPSAISTLKLRAAYGETGRAPGATAALQTYVSAPYLTDTGLLVTGGVAPGNPGNPDLEPERGTEFEAGFDLGLFRDRFGVELTYFDKTSHDLIVTNPIPVSSGFASSPAANIGEMKNTGFEISAHATLVDLRNVTWDVGLNLNTLHNELVTVENVAPINNRRCFKPGVEIAAFCVNQIVAVDTVTGIVTVSDTAQFLGGQLPKREGNLRTTLTLFRAFRIYAQADGKFDYLIYNFGREFRDRLNGPNANSREGVLTREELGLSLYEWYRLHPNGIRTVGGASTGLTNEDEDYFEDGGYIRLRELSLTWSLPANLAERLHLGGGASLTVGGRNLALWTDYRGYDPEVLAVDTDAAIFRADLFTVPPARRLFARVNVQF